MRRTVILALSVALIVLVFAPIAAAQINYGGGGNQGMNSGGMGSGGMNGMRMNHNNMGMGHNMMASPASSASASTTPSASASTTATPTATSSATTSANPSASASARATGSAMAAPSHELPHTGGIPLVPLLSVGALVLLAGSGVFAARLRR
jgi:LPXTG-motif cell wall-anchored protein